MSHSLGCLAAVFSHLEGKGGETPPSLPSPSLNTCSLAQTHSSNSSKGLYHSRALHRRPVQSEESLTGVRGRGPRVGGC